MHWIKNTIYKHCEHTSLRLIVMMALALVLLFIYHVATTPGVG